MIPFSKFVDNPQYNSGALFMVKTSSEVQTLTEMKTAGATGDNILFDFNSAALQPQYHAELDKIGEYVQSNPDSFVVLAGFTDSVGSEEYNLGLSRRRAEGVAAYLMNNANVAEDRIVMQWFGKLNPVAGNDTAEGRSMNRRVEVAVGME